MNPYREKEIQSASPAQLIVMFYEEAIISIKRAKLYVDNVPSRVQNITKAINIISGLMLALDGEAECVEYLAPLYQYYVETLTYANREKDVEKMDEVIIGLDDLLQTWKKAIASL